MTQQRTAQHPPKAEADQLRDLESARLRALVASDMQTIHRLHAFDFQLITPRGNALSKEQYLEAIAGGEIKYLMWEPGVMEVRVHDGVALIRYKARLQLASVERLKPSFECWHTDSYEKRDGCWQVVRSQATKIE